MKRSRHHHGQRPSLRARSRAAAAARAFPPRHGGPDRHQGRLRHEPVRRVHRAARRRRRASRAPARRAGRRRAVTTIEGLAPDGHAAPAAGSVLGEARAAVRLLHAGDDPRGARAAATCNPNADAEQIRHGLEGNLCRCTGYQNIVRAVQRRPPRRARADGDDGHGDPHASSAPASGAARIRGCITGTARYTDDIDAARAWCTRRSCAARTPTRGSRGSTRQPRQGRARRRRRLHRRRQRERAEADPVRVARAERRPEDRRLSGAWRRTSCATSATPSPSSSPRRRTRRTTRST